MIQLAIFILTGTSAWMFSSKTKSHLGFVFGLAAQPFWFIAAFQAKQWGMLALCFYYGFCHVRGILNNIDKFRKG